MKDTREILISQNRFNFLSDNETQIEGDGKVNYVSGNIKHASHIDCSNITINIKVKIRRRCEHFTKKKKRRRRKWVK